MAEHITESDQGALGAYVAAILSCPVVAEKSRGVPSPDGESAAVFESIAVNLLLHPRTVLYLAHLARNGLVKSLTDEIAAVDEVAGLVRDFSNTSFAVKDTSALEQARTSLLQIEGQGRLVGDSAALGRFNQSVSSFLTELGKSVKGASAQMLRPSQEAESLLPGAYQRLVAAHKESTDRLSYLSSGPDSFFSSNIGSMVSVATVQTIRNNIEALLKDFGKDDSAASSRNAVYHLIAARSVLKMLGSPPAWDDEIPVTGTCPGGSIVTLSDPATIQPGDVLGGIEVLDVDGTTVELAGNLLPFNGTIPVVSGLVRMWSTLRYEVGEALEEWRAGSFSEDLSKLDQALAGLTAASPAVQVGEALRMLASLRATLVTASNHLHAPRPRSVQNEKRTVDGILETLEERGYDRAVAMLLRCKIVETFKLDWQTASFAGYLMKASSDVAQNDVQFPNKEKDENTVFSRREEP